MAKTAQVRNGPTEEEKSYYTAYGYHSNLLRTWLVAYGIGGPVLFINSAELYKKLVGSGQASLIAKLFLVGVFLQVSLSAINKTIMWTLYYGAICCPA